MYIYHNKTTDQLLAFSSIKAIHLNTGINLDTLYYQFTRCNNTLYEKEDFRIIKVDLIRSKRKH